MNDTNPIFHSLTLIEENIQKKLTVESLADSIHLSKYHYQRMFRDAVGDSVMKYVTRRRLSLAATELAGTNASILEIALKYGYGSHEGFTRSFRSYMGVSPKEYRKYHVSIESPTAGKEKDAMLYSKTTDGIIRELNNLIVQAKETAAYTRQHTEETASKITASYSEFWDVISASTDAMADELSSVLERITGIPQCPDGISARFLIVKAIEDAAFKSHVTAFQIKLMAARAKPKECAAFRPICDKYGELAQNAQLKAGRIVAFFNELSALIFQDIRETTAQKLQDAATEGMAAAKRLSDVPASPYAYISDEIKEIAEGLSSLTLEDMSVSILEDDLFRLDIAASAASLDMLRMPSHKPLFDGIPAFRKKLEDVAIFFQNLPMDMAQGVTKPQESQALERTASKERSDLAFQAHILLFYLKGEIQKLGQRLDEGQEAAFRSICTEMDAAVQLAGRAEDEPSLCKIAGLLQNLYGKMSTEAGKLGIYGAPVQFLAEEILHLASHIAAAHSNGTAVSK